MTATAAPAKKRPKRRPKPVVATNAPTTFTVESGADGMRVWTLTFPAPDRMLSVNGNPHWRTTSPVRKTWREAMFVYARAAKLPTGLPRVRIDMELRFPAAGRRDAANYHGNVVKPCVDALGPEVKYTRGGKAVEGRGHGLIADDTAEYLDGPFVRLGAKVADPKRCPFGEVVVTITELSGAVAL